MQWGSDASPCSWFWLLGFRSDVDACALGIYLCSARALIGALGAHPLCVARDRRSPAHLDTAWWPVRDVACVGRGWCRSWRRATFLRGRLGRSALEDLEYAGRSWPDRSSIRRKVARNKTLRARIRTMLCFLSGLGLFAAEAMLAAPSRSGESGPLETRFRDQDRARRRG